MAIDRPGIRPGMNVLDAEGGKLGTVKEVRGNDFKIDRPLAPDVYVHFEDVETVNEDTVTLKLGAREVDDLSWV